MEILYENQLYLIYLIGVMISSGIIKEYGYFTNVFYMLHSNIKSKRLLVVLISFVSGVLPIPGRVTVSAGILDMVAPENKSRSKFGIIDYLSTHHYYFWSPLEKTIIIPMAALGITYGQMFSHVFPLLLVSIFVILWYIFMQVKEEDIEVQTMVSDYSLKNIVLEVSPILVGIILMVFGIDPWVSFTGVAFYYITYSKSDFREVVKYINWNLVFALFGIIVASNLVKGNYNEILTFFKENPMFNMETIQGFLLISAFGFLFSFAMGSSSKYAGIVAMLSTVYGIQYLTWFFAVEFVGYILSPTHKCLSIGKMYFQTPIVKYVEVVSIWGFMVLLTAFASLV